MTDMFFVYSKQLFASFFFKRAAKQIVKVRINFDIVTQIDINLSDINEDKNLSLNEQPV